jgi:ABC-type lipoprotein export system ATPase subunit
MIDQNMLSAAHPHSQPLSSPSQPILEAKSIHRIFTQGDQEVPAISDVSCVIQPGDQIAIIGPSGSGKSTLLHLFACLDQPSSGTITWPALGDPSNLRPSHIGVAPQIPAMLPPLNVLENVALPLLLQDIRPEEARRIAGNYLELLELNDLADQLPEELSGGQAQRIALARALVTQPRLLLADEPTGQLDHPTAQQLFDLLFSAIADRGIALVVTTHDPAVAERFDQVWQIHQGRLKGAPRDA